MSELEQFRDAIRSAGLEPPDIIVADGKLRRFASNGKRGDDAGWYVLYGDGIPAGSFGDWRTGISAIMASRHWPRSQSSRRIRAPGESRSHAARTRSRGNPAQSRSREQGDGDLEGGATGDLTIIPILSGKASRPMEYVFTMAR